VHRVRIVLFIFGELGNVASLYPTDRFVTGEWDTKQFIDALCIEKVLKKFGKFNLIVAFFHTRHILVILIVQNNGALLGGPYSNLAKPALLNKYRASN